MDVKNHYRGHGTGMVSMGSEDMIHTGSEPKPVYSPSEEGNNTEPAVSSIVLTLQANEAEPLPQLPHHKGANNSTTELPSSADTSVERSPQTISRASGEVTTFLDYLFVDDKLVGATLAKMSNMLDAYFSDR
jgi:hypothetical protein